MSTELTRGCSSPFRFDVELGGGWGRPPAARCLASSSASSIIALSIAHGRLSVTRARASVNRSRPHTSKYDNCRRECWISYRRISSNRITRTYFCPAVCALQRDDRVRNHKMKNERGKNRDVLSRTSRRRLNVPTRDSIVSSLILSAGFTSFMARRNVRSIWKSPSIKSQNTPYKTPLRVSSALDV